MIIPSSIAQRFELDQPYIKAVSEMVKDQVYGFSERKGFAFIGRLKTCESLTEKLESGRFNRWADVDDLYACSVVVPTLTDEGSVLEFLDQTYERVDLRLRGATKKDPSVFRFDATRFVGRLREAPQLASDSPLRRVLFEVQIRTAFEHAWSVTTHALSYKPDRVDWKRLRLAAQLKAAVEQLDGLILGFDAIAAGVSEHRWPEVSAKSHIASSFRRLVEEGKLPKETAPSSWARFSDNLYSVVAGSSNKSIRHIEERVQEAVSIIVSAIDKYKAANYPRSLTLLQVCIGCLVEAGFITEPFQRYVPLVTVELKDLFPQVQLLGSGFALD